MNYTINATIHNHAFCARFYTYESAELCAIALSEVYMIPVAVVQGMKTVCVIQYPEPVITRSNIT